MKIVFVLALGLACIIALCEKTSALPAGTDAAAPKEASKDVKDAIQKAKEAKKSKKNCTRDCGIKYEPVCVHDPENIGYKPRTFSGQCVLDVHNCEMGTKLVVKSKGECPNSGGVRLS